VQRNECHFLLDISYSEVLKVSKVRFDVRDKNKSSSEDEAFTKIEETPKEQWDCESILSTLRG
jgi:hypothetical protein